MDESPRNHPARAQQVLIGTSTLSMVNGVDLPHATLEALFGPHHEHSTQSADVKQTVQVGLSLSLQTKGVERSISRGVLR